MESGGSPDVAVLNELVGTGTLRAAVNLGNPLLVTGRTASGEPEGVSPDMARAVADRLGVPVRYVTFASPGEIADAVSADLWDIALIANEAERAEMVAFSPAYVEIEATYLIPEGSTARSVEDLDRPGVRIAVSARSAYDLHLGRTLRDATLMRGDGLAGALDRFRSERLDALAGLRPALAENARDIPGSSVLDGRFATVRQAIGVLPQNLAATEFLEQLVRALRTDGTVQALIDRHGVTGRLQVGTDG